MKDPECPRCGAEMHHIHCNVLGYADNGHMYECTECEYQDYIPPRLRKTLPRTYSGEIIGLRATDDGETVLHVKLDNPEESIRHCHVRITECEQS